ncbi:molybdopterin-dependent oxidoreductase [Arenibaculum pallidiluteum]|uniref:molybdopterin-dependent oxidoreductase n=1 Tax=Arenibaculum pallidiluteum TaxID=2812559 RepID=UPI001A976EF5|nr:molybdopterin-dependent oxidoreductase [Arenibaculum pallidiluteum]
MLLRSAAALLLYLVAHMPLAALAEGLAAPTGRVILTVEGAVSHTNAGTTAQFDREMLERLPQHEIETSTPWASQVVRFAGPRLSDVLDLVGARGARLHATAHNDYKAEIPVADAAKHGVVLALKADGRYLSLRERGPIWIVYPLDSDPSLVEAGAGDRMVWQLARLRVE